MAESLDRWQARYLAGEGCAHQPDPLILRAAQLLPPGRAIDVACGAGRHALALAARGWQVTAVDGAPAALALFDAPGITKLCLDLSQSIPPLDADLVVIALYLDRALLAKAKAEASAVAIVLPMIDDDAAVKPMNSAYLVAPGEPERIFAGWRVLHAGERKAPGKRRVYEFLAASR
jgi:SAM-dependent methyltransferase